MLFSKQKHEGKPANIQKRFELLLSRNMLSFDVCGSAFNLQVEAVSLPLAELKFVNNVKAEPFYPSGHTTLCSGQKEFHGPEDSQRKISDVQ